MKKKPKGSRVTPKLSHLTKPFRLTVEKGLVPTRQMVEKEIRELETEERRGFLARLDIERSRRP